MFNWTTTTIVNELPKMNLEKNGSALRIDKYLFEKRWVESIRKANGHDYKLCEATVDLNNLKFADASVARLYIYVGLDGSEESIYANDWYRKGMPLSVSFAVSDDAAAMADAIVEAVNTFNVFTKVKKVLDVTAKDGVLTIKGTHEHQRLQKIAILREVANNLFGEETPVVSYEKGRTTLPVGSPITIVEDGVNGFGTYSQLLKDLRLPTAVHNHWLNVQKNEMPIVGEVYTQYIINYYAPSSANPSFTAVGNRSMSETTHVFWVKESLVPDWEEQLKKLDPNGGEFLTTPAYKDASDIFVDAKESLVEGSEE